MEVWKPKKKKNTLKRFLLIFLGLILAGIALFILAAWIWFLGAFKQYSNKQEGVSIKYPKTWVVAEKPLEGVIVTLISPKENALDSTQENVNISVYAMSDEVFTTDQYADLLLEQMLAVFKDLEVLRKDPFLVAGHYGYRMELISKEAAKVFIIYAFTVGKTGVNMLYFGDTTRYHKDILTLDLMALTFRVRY